MYKGFYMMGDSIKNIIIVYSVLREFFILRDSFKLL